MATRTTTKKIDRGADIRVDESDIPVGVVRAAQLLGLHENTVRSLISKGKISAFKAGRNLRISPQEIEDYKARQVYVAL